MWNEAESEVIRLKKIFAKSIGTPDALLKKFLSSPREEAKLALALLGYFSIDPKNKQYETYLLRRLRPAVFALIEETAISEIEALEALSPFSPEMLDECLQAAADMGRPEVIAYLLLQKARNYGFHDRDFSL